MIPVTKTFLPPQSEYQAILHRAWKKGWITNRGELVIELEQKLKARLSVPHLVAMTNGTLPLQIAIKTLNIKGDIITTPFSYVATTSCIAWEGCNPIFVDINPEFLTIDETRIEAAITANTSAILATHVFGNPCNIEAISALASKHNLKVIYDAAHCFDVEYKNNSIFNYGDISTCSFHATKLFHTGEGGAIFTNDKILLDKLFYHHNFGHKGHEEFYGLGINAKMSELQAAMGLAVLPYIDRIKAARELVVLKYTEAFQGLPSIQLLRWRSHTSKNYSYFPVIFENTEILNKVKSSLEKKNIFARRYFYPSLNKLPYVHSLNTPVSESISQRILCLPLYYGLSDTKVQEIIDIILEAI